MENKVTGIATVGCHLSVPLCVFASSDPVSVPVSLRLLSSLITRSLSNSPTSDHLYHTLPLPPPRSTFQVAAPLAQD